MGNNQRYERDMIEHHIKAATCRVTCGKESGTGWLISKDVIITARHCVLDAITDGQQIELFFPERFDNAIVGKIVAESEQWDASLISLETTSAAEPLSVSLDLPREGETWKTFGYPIGKPTLGHRLSGAVAQALGTPKLKIDLDLSVDLNVALRDYRGLSGAVIVCEGVAVGMIRLKIDNTVAALSLNQMESFLAENGVTLPSNSTASSSPLLAERGDFAKAFIEAVQNCPGSYLFLEGAHGYGKSTFCRGIRADEKTHINLGAYSLSDPESALGADYWAQPQVFLDWLTTKISGLITGQPPRKEEKSYSEQILQSAQYLSEFSKYCEQSMRQGLFFIDGLNEVPGDVLLRQLLGMLPAKLPPKITVVLTAPNFSNVASALSGKVNAKDVFKLPPLADGASYSYCLNALNPERRSAELANRISEKAKGHPLYLRYLIEYANSHATDDDLNDFPSLTGPIEEYYQGIWAKLLPDSDAVHLLALMARLRWGMPLADFTNALYSAEQGQFVSVKSRIRHLLADEDNTAIYHSSFTTFIIEQTKEIDEFAYRRLAQFCLDQTNVRYCTLNLIFHLLRADDNRVFAECNQAWVDTTVTLGVEPDTLIADVEAVVKRAAIEASADEFIRLMLLSQRISFRYDTLFAQSARLIAEALIVLGRPREALQHVNRFKTIIVGPDDALQIAFLFHQHGYDEEALDLLDELQKRIVENYNLPSNLLEFMKLCSWHLRTIFLIRQANGWRGMKQASSVFKMAQRACDELSKEADFSCSDVMLNLYAESPIYFLTFKDVYADLSTYRSYQNENDYPELDLSQHLQTLCIALLEFEKSVEEYNLPKARTALDRLFADLYDLLQSSEVEATLALVVADTLIRFGAPSQLVELLLAKGGEQPMRPLQIRAKNGVDVNHKDLHECLCDWRVAAFLDSKFRAPSSGIITSTGWFESIEHMIGALYCCDGRARRAKADSDENAWISCRDQLKAQVIEPLRFTLQQRAEWTNSYAIPETVLPEVYRQLAELLDDCFPEEIPHWLDNLVASADGQWGMYSEGFRASAYHLLEQLTREKVGENLAPKLFGLLHALRDHVIRGVENRHELVPEILRMIPIFANLGAKEEAERLYQQLLSVSMGPTWYKEDQLSIMIETLGSISVSNEGLRLPEVAGYLERASGEMTFQRYVRSEKSSLIGKIAQQGRYRAAIAYFRRQCCGSTAELWGEAQQGTIDKVGPLKGNRFPGGALEDQAAVLELVRNSGTVSWTLRWALLEIFHCGDSRYLTDYAVAFAKITNESGSVHELVRRAEVVANAETTSDDRPLFASAFRSALKPELHTAFATLLVGFPPLKSPETPTPKKNVETGDDETDNRLFHPGVFGRQKAIRDADMILEEVEKQLTLGNHKAAKVKAVKVLQALQNGGWGIWGDLSASARRAEEILVQEEVNAVNVIRYYAPLIEAERYVPKWIPAQHLIGRFGPLLNEMEGQRLLNAVIDHCRLMVGDAAKEIQGFDFLADDSAELSPDVEFFQFIIWLCNHPQWIRRDRAAAMLLWLVEQVPDLFSEAVTIAFSMDEGYGPDVLCGVLDGASVRDPVAVWEKIVGVLDLTKVTQELRHVSRMAVLERLATRADKTGLPAAKSAMGLIKDSFTGEYRTGGNPKLPIWASCLHIEWQQIVNLVDLESFATWEKELEQLCSPLSITNALALETAVSTSFREGHNKPFNRWESKVRHALNLALWSHVSRDGASVVEASLRSYNPSQPERTVQGMSNSFTDQLITAIESGDYSAALGSNEMVFLNYHDMAVKFTEDGASHLEVLCLLQPHSNQRGFFGPKLAQSFRSSELPLASTVMTPFETCCRLEPNVVFFGPFTPATPLPFFQNLVEAKDEDFVRQNWRYGRRNEIRGFGQPERGGCLLSVPRKALRVPPGFKLAWLVWIDRKLVTFIDERNNRLI